MGFHQSDHPDVPKMQGLHLFHFVMSNCSQRVRLALEEEGPSLDQPPAEPAEQRAISLETGIQNAPLALGIIIASFSGELQQEILRIPLLYGVLVVPASALLAWRLRRQPSG